MEDQANKTHGHRLTWRIALLAFVGTLLGASIPVASSWWSLRGDLRHNEDAARLAVYREYLSATHELTSLAIRFRRSGIDIPPDASLQAQFREASQRLNDATAALVLQGSQPAINQSERLQKGLQLLMETPFGSTPPNEQIQGHLDSLCQDEGEFVNLARDDVHRPRLAGWPCFQLSK
jgi:hypothetical protein